MSKNAVALLEPSRWKFRRVAVHVVIHGVKALSQRPIDPKRRISCNKYLKYGRGCHETSSLWELQNRNGIRKEMPTNVNKQPATPVTIGHCDVTHDVIMMCR